MRYPDPREELHGSVLFDQQSPFIFFDIIVFVYATDVCSELRTVHDPFFPNVKTLHKFYDSMKMTMSQVTMLIITIIKHEFDNN